MTDTNLQGVRSSPFERPSAMIGRGMRNPTALAGRGFARFLLGSTGGFDRTPVELITLQMQWRYDRVRR
jgi:hypothetical protein